MHAPDLCAGSVQSLSRPTKGNGESADSELPLDAYAWRLIHKKSKQLAGKYGFLRGDRADIAQELALDLVRRWPKFDPRKCDLRQFMQRVVRHKVCHLIQQQRAKSHILMSSDQELDARTDGCQRAHLGTEFRDPLQQHELIWDVQLVLASLSQELRQVGELLFSHSEFAISRELNISRKAVRKAVERLRQHFALAGLEKEFESAPGQQVGVCQY